MHSQYSHLEGDPANKEDINKLMKGLGSIRKSKRRKSLMALDVLSMDPNSRASMIHAGALAMLSKLLLEKRSENTTVVLSILSSMACDSTRARKELLDTRVVPYVVRIAVSGSTDAKCKGLSLLYYLSIEERGLNQLVNSGIFGELVFLVHLGRAEYEEWVFKLLGNLIQRFPISLSPWIQVSTIQTLIDLACDTSGAMKVHLIRLLTVILESSSDFAIHFSSKGLEMFVTALTPISGDKECREWAIRALSAISSRSECVRVLASQIGIDPIMEMLWQDCDIVKEHALRVISDLAKFPAGIEQGLLLSLDIVPTFLSSEYHVLQEWSARILGNIAALDNCARLNQVYGAVMRDLFLGLKSPNRSVTLSFLQAIRQILNCRNSLHSYVRDCEDLGSLIKVCFSGTLDVDLLEASLNILSDLCIARDDVHGILVRHSAVEHLLGICISPHLCDVVEPSLCLLSMLVTTDIGLVALRQALDSSDGWKVLSGVLRRKKESWSCHTLDIITRVISETVGEVHANLLGDEINLIAESIKSPSLCCQKSGVHTIVSLVESSPVYSTQLVNFGILSVLVGLINSSNPELANPAAKALGAIALGDREHKDLIAEARALPALIQWLLNGEDCDLPEVLKALCHIVEDHEENCNVLVSGNVDRLAALLVSEVKTVTSDAPFSTVLLIIVCRTWKSGVLGILEETTVAKEVLINLHEMAAREQELWQNRVLFSSRMLLSSALVLDNSDLESVAELTVIMMNSCAEAVRHEAGDILREIVSKLKYIPKCVQAGGTEMLVLVLKATGVVCEEALDLLLEQHGYDDRKAASFSNAGGIRVLVEIMTFGTNTCKAKSALLVSNLSGSSREFCSEAIRCGLVKPLVILLAMEDSSCRTAAGEALLRLLGKSIVDLDHKERVQVIMETLDSEGCEFEDEIALMRNFDALNIASSGSDHYFDCEQTQESDSEVETQEINGSPSISEDHLLCPITHELMIAPVMAADGYVYEREAIAAWFENHVTSPMTNLELSCLDLIPIDDMEVQIALLSR